jgi:hypothetical protein
MMNLLAQNPSHHVTPTSGLVNMFSLVVNHWHKNQWFQSEGLKHVKPRIKHMLSGMLGNYFHDELLEGKRVFDKNREWPFYLRNLEEILERPVKIILMVRDVRGIVSSFERLYRGRGIEYHYPFMNEDAWHAMHSLEGRAQLLLGPKGVIGTSVNTIRDVVRHYGNQSPNRLVKVSYERFTAEPLKVMRAIHKSLGLPEFEYDVDHVNQVTEEDDLTFHGMDLHTVRPKIEYRERDWTNLPDKLIEELGEAYADINSQDPKFKPTEKDAT